MFIDMKDVMRIRERTHIVEVETRYWLEYDREEVLMALGESYLYMMAHEFPGFKILGKDMESTVFQDFDTNVMKFAIWWAPPAGECYFPELGHGIGIPEPGRTRPKVSVKMLKQPEPLRARPQMWGPSEPALQQLYDDYDLAGWSDTVHAWIYKRRK